MDSTRFFDVLFSFIGLIVLLPLFIIIAFFIKITSKGPVFYVQYRVGKDEQDFKLIKFRSMKVDADKKRSLTIGGRDDRITVVGYFLRRFKLDELPQLINVLKGEMSIVGPRPELRKYVELYSVEQKKVLKVLPGITDRASIAFRNESDLLATTPDPEKFYIEKIIPRKIELNKLYISNKSLSEYFKIIKRTILISLKG